MRNKEESLQIAVSRYLKLQYPDVIFTSESSGIKLSIGSAVKAKKQRNPERGLPDLIILEPRCGFSGLCVELKAEGKSPYLKDGSLSKNKHIQEQNDVLIKLKEKGYIAKFAVGFDDAKKLIDNYMNQIQNHA